MLYVCTKILYYRLSEDWTVLVNGLSGALDIVPAPVAADLRAGAVRRLPDGLAQHLMERGYLLSSPEEERHLLETFARLSTEHWSDRLLSRNFWNGRSCIPPRCR